MSQQNREPIIFVVYKDPNSSGWYGVDWSDFLSEGADVLSSSWIVPEGITQLDDQLTSPIAKIKVSGGTLDRTYDIVNRVTFGSDSEIEDQTIRFIICQK